MYLSNGLVQSAELSRGLTDSPSWRDPIGRSLQYLRQLVYPYTKKETDDRSDSSSQAPSTSQASSGTQPTRKDLQEQIAKLEDDQKTLASTFMSVVGVPPRGNGTDSCANDPSSELAIKQSKRERTIEAYADNRKLIFELRERLAQSA